MEIEAPAPQPPAGDMRPPIVQRSTSSGNRPGTPPTGSADLVRKLQAQVRKLKEDNRRLRSRKNGVPKRKHPLNVLSHAIDNDGTPHKVRLGRAASITTAAVIADTPISRDDPLAERMIEIFSKPLDHVEHLRSVDFADDILRICELVNPIFEREQRVISLQSPVYVFGDIHGNIEDLHFFADNIWKLGMNLTAGRFLFLGDYVDRGLSGLECVGYLLALKVLYPCKIYLLRGNHELRDVNGWETHYQERSFLRQCKDRFGVAKGIEVWEAVNKVFDRLPLAAVIDRDIFCVHGGIPRPLDSNELAQARLATASANQHVRSQHHLPQSPSSGIPIPFEDSSPTFAGPFTMASSPSYSHSLLGLTSSRPRSYSSSSSISASSAGPPQQVPVLHPGLSSPGSPAPLGTPRGATRMESILVVPIVAGVAPTYSYETGSTQRVASDCLWSDPASDEQEAHLDSNGFGASVRGGGAICFGSKAVDDFLKDTGYSYIIRAHEAHAEGVALCKGARVFTVFSTSKDHGQGSAAMAGCILVDVEEIQVINRSPAYQNRFVHRRDSAALVGWDDALIDTGIDLGLVMEDSAGEDDGFEDEDESGDADEDEEIELDDDEPDLVTHSRLQRGPQEAYRFEPGSTHFFGTPGLDDPMESDDDYHPPSKRINDLPLFSEGAELTRDGSAGAENDRRDAA